MEFKCTVTIIIKGELEDISDLIINVGISWFNRPNAPNDIVSYYF
jgi:hypothetical protein